MRDFLLWVVISTLLLAAILVLLSQTQPLFR